MMSRTKLLLGALVGWLALSPPGLAEAQTQSLDGLSLPAGSYYDTSGAAIGPHGGTLTRADDYLLELVVREEGQVQVYAYDAEGMPVAIDEVDLDQLTLATEQGQVDVRLRREAGYPYLLGYYDPFYFDPFWYGAGFLWVYYPPTILIRDRPVVIPRTPTRGYGEAVPGGAAPRSRARAPARSAPVDPGNAAPSGRGYRAPAAPVPSRPTPAPEVRPRATPAPSAPPPSRSAPAPSPSPRGYPAGRPR
jgi:hypothetical protein